MPVFKFDVEELSLSFQSSSIDFLANQGFDFNKVFCNGMVHCLFTFAPVREPYLRAGLASIRTPRTVGRGEGTCSRILLGYDYSAINFSG